MIFDSLTLAGWAMVILVIALVLGAMLYSHLTLKKNLKIVTRNMILMHADDEMRELCKKIMSINPDACPLMDGGANKLIKANPEKLKSILKTHLSKLESTSG